MLDFALADLENGEEHAVLDLPGPKGLQGQPSRPVIALLHEAMPVADETSGPRPTACARTLPRPVVEAPGGTMAPSHARFQGCAAKASRLCV